MEPAFLTLCLQRGAKLLQELLCRDHGAAQEAWSWAQGSQCSQKYHPSYGVGKGKAVSLSMALRHLGNGRVGHPAAPTSPAAACEQGREDSSSGCVNHNHHSQQSSVGQRETHCTWLQGGGGCCWSLSILSVPPHNDPSSPAPGFAASISQRWAGSRSHLISHYIWSGCEHFSYLLLWCIGM